MRFGPQSARASGHAVAPSAFADGDSSTPTLPHVRGPGLPSPSRLRLEHHPRDEHIQAAVLHVPEEGGAIRTLVGGAHQHLVGVYRSKKTGLANPYEGRIERALLHWCEANARVDFYQSQAARLVFLTDDGFREWIIDLLRQLDDGTIEAVEVKRSWRDLRNPDYRLKLAHAKAIVESFGWRFRIMFADEIIGPPPRRHNVARIQTRRNVRIGKDARGRFENLVSNHSRVSFKDLRESLDTDVIKGVAMAQGLMAAGRVAVDLDQHIRDNTIVELRRPKTARSRIRF